MLGIKDNTKLYFISDTHFYHDKCIDYCSRPFEYNIDYDISRIDIMKCKLIENWNKIVPEDGIVIIGGDFAFTSNIEKITTLLNSLNGTKYLVLGNHCYQNKFDRKSVRELFEGTSDILDVKVFDEEIDDGFQWINVCHYPIEAWSKKAKGSWMLHGHIHSGSLSTAKDRNIRFIPNRYDIGVDNNNFTPVSYSDIKTIITRQNLKGEL